MDDSSAPPPGPSIPPPLTTPPLLAARREPKRNGWRIAAVVLIILLVISVGSQLSWFMGSLMQEIGGVSTVSTMTLEETVIEDNKSLNKITVIAVEGLIMDGTMEAGSYGLVRYVQDQLKLAKRDPRVKAVLLKINSPGGEVLASDEISQAIAAFQTESGKPVIAAMGSVAASGGYYVAAPCRWIVANDLTITGSIGVIMHNYNYRGLMNKIGLRPQVYKSGRFKDMLSGERDLEQLSPKDRETVELEEQMIQRMIDQTYRRFKEVVSKGRAAANNANRSQSESKGRPLAKNWEEYADGRVWTGTEALEYGFVDETGGWQTAVQRARSMAGVAQANLVQYRQPFGLANFFRLLGRTDAAKIQVNVGPELPPLQPGLLYFLAPTYLR